MVSCVSVLYLLYRVDIITRTFSIMKRVETIPPNALYFFEGEYVWLINLIVLVHGRQEMYVTPRWIISILVKSHRETQLLDGLIAYNTNCTQRFITKLCTYYDQLRLWKKWIDWLTDKVSWENIIYHCFLKWIFSDFWYCTSLKLKICFMSLSMILPLWNRTFKLQHDTPVAVWSHIHTDSFMVYHV